MFVVWKCKGGWTKIDFSDRNHPLHVLFNQEDENCQAFIFCFAIIQKCCRIWLEKAILSKKYHPASGHELSFYAITVDVPRCSWMFVVRNRRQLLLLLFHFESLLTGTLKAGMWAKKRAIFSTIVILICSRNSNMQLGLLIQLPFGYEEAIQLPGHIRL